MDSWRPSLRKRAEELGFEFGTNLLAENPNSAYVIDAVSGLGRPLVVSVQCRFLLKAPFLKACGRAVNVHNAPLPLLRGLQFRFKRLYMK